MVCHLLFLYDVVCEIYLKLHVQLTIPSNSPELDTSPLIEFFVGERTFQKWSYKHIIDSFPDGE